MTKQRQILQIPLRQQLRRKRLLYRFVSIILASVITIYLNKFFDQEMKDLNDSDFFFLATDQPPIYADYSISLEKLRSHLEPRCTCRKGESACVSLDEFEKYTVHLTKNATINTEYKMGMLEFDYSNIACNPFNVLRRGRAQKIISYSIDRFESNQIGHLKLLIRSAKEYYPDWIIRVYHKGDIDIGVICELECLQNEFNQEYDNIDFCNINELVFTQMNMTHVPGPFWRWLPIGDYFVDAFISRDFEACIGEREALAVNEWMSSEYPFHVIRDRPTHQNFIEPGLWGLKTKRQRRLSDGIFQKLTDQNRADWHMKHYLDKRYVYEQLMFLNEIHEVVRENVLVHASYNCDRFAGEFLRPFTVKRTAQYCLDRRIGYGCCQSIDENDYYLGRNDQIRKEKFCPLQCRPKNQKTWLFC